MDTQTAYPQWKNSHCVFWCTQKPSFLFLYILVVSFTTNENKHIQIDWANMYECSWLCLFHSVVLSSIQFKTHVDGVCAAIAYCMIVDEAVWKCFCAQYVLSFACKAPQMNERRRKYRNTNAQLKRRTWNMLILSLFSSALAAVHNGCFVFSLGKSIFRQKSKAKWWS